MSDDKRHAIFKVLLKHEPGTTLSLEEFDCYEAAEAFCRRYAGDGELEIIKFWVKMTDDKLNYSSLRHGKNTKAYDFGYQEGLAAGRAEAKVLVDALEHYDLSHVLDHYDPINPGRHECEAVTMASIALAAYKRATEGVCE